MQEIIFFLVILSYLPKIVENKLPMIENNMVFYNGFAPRTDYRRLLRIMNESNYVVNEVFALDVVSNKLKSFDYLTQTPNYFLQPQYRVLDYNFLPNMTGIFIGTQDTLTMSLFVADIRENNFLKVNASLGTIQAFQNATLVPFYPLREDGLYDPNYFIVFIANNLSIYDGLLNLKNTIIGDFISVCTFPERNIIVAATSTGLILVWTYSVSKTDHYSLFEYTNYMLDTSSNVNLVRIKGSLDIFATLTSSTNIIRLWSLGQGTNYMNISISFNASAIISVDGSLILAFNLHLISFVNINNQIINTYNFSDVELQDAIALPDVAGLVFLTSDGSFLYNGIDLNDPNCCDFQVIGQDDAMADFSGRDDLMFLSYTDENAQRWYVAAVVSEDLQALIYYPFPPGPSTFSFVNLTKNIYLVSLLHQVNSSINDNTNVDINTQGSISHYEFDTNSYELFYIQDIPIVGSGNIQGAVTLYSTPSVTSYLSISSPNKNIYIYDPAASGNNLITTYPSEGEIVQFCQRNDFTSMVYYYIDDETGLYKIGRKAISSTFVISDFPFGNSLDTMTFTQVYDCVNSRGLQGLYSFLVLNDTTNLPQIIQYTESNDPTILSGKNVWADVIDDGILYTQLNTGFITISDFTDSTSLSLYYGDDVKIMKFDANTIFAFGKHEIYSKTIGGNCGYAPFLSAIETDICYTDCTQNNPPTVIVEYIDLFTCSALTTCPTGTYTMTYNSPDYSPNQPFDVCKNNSYQIEFCMISNVTVGQIVCSQCLPSYYLLFTTGANGYLYCVDPTNDPRLAIVGTQPTDGTGICQFCSTSNSNCLECNGIADNCTKCFPNYELNIDSTGKYSCINCLNDITNCGLAYCDSTKHCVLCLPNYWINNGTCVSSCTPPLLFTNEVSALGHCYACSSIPYCTSCSATGCSQCTTGYFLNSTGSGICQVCNSSSTLSNCLQCSDSATCIQCVVFYNVKSGICVPDCSNNCKAGCASCYGLNCDSCLSCPPGKFLLAKSCFVQCPFGYYPYASAGGQVCGQCDPACESCQGPLKTDCLSCNIPQFLFNGSCVASCLPRRYFPDTINYICQPCYESCLTCTGPNDDQCITCLSIYKYFTNGRCTKCKIGCVTCDDTTPSLCSLCSTGFYLFGTDCLDECPLCYFPSQGSCVACDTSCLTCNGTGATECTSCEVPYVLNAGVCGLSNEQAIPDPYPPNTFPAQLFADWNVQTSNSSSLVTQCGTDNIMGGVSAFPQSIYQIFNFLNSPPIFEIIINFTLFKIDNWNYNNLFVLSNGTIIFEQNFSTEGTSNLCNGNTVQNDQSFNISAIAEIEWPVVNVSIGVDAAVLWGIRDIIISMNKCDSSCLTCTGYLSDQCSTCYPLASLIDGTCTCLPGFYQVINVSCVNFPCSTCQSCNIICKSCNGSSAQNCTDCYDSYELVNTTCVISGNNLTVTQDLNSESIGSTQINWNVAEVNNIGRLLDSTPTYVNGCDDNSMMLGGQGIFTSTTQISKTFSLSYNHYSVNFKATLYLFYTLNAVNILEFTFDDTVFDVAPADFDFTTYGYCSSSSRNDTSLTSFKNIDFTFDHTSPNLTVTINSTIIDPTSNESWGIKDIQILQFPCDYTCYSCIGPLDSDCLLCGSSFYYDPFTGLCEANCSDGSYGDPDSGQCLSCDSSCEQCYGPDWVDCLSCFQGNFLFMNVCLDQCVDGTFADQSPTNGSAICTLCDPSCLTCDGALNTSCLTCDSDNFPVYYSNKQCLPCNPKCQICNDGSPNDCSECSDNYTLFRKTCTNVLPLGFYAQKFPSGSEFLPCDNSCKTCSNKTKYDCLSCSNGKLLALTGECLNQCSIGTFWSTENKACTPCDSSCKECNGATPENCTACSYGLYLIPDKKICVKSTEITVTMVVISNPTDFGLVFSDYWKELMASISNYVTLTISSMKTSDFSYKVIQSPDNQNMAEIIIDYQKNITKGSQAFISLNDPTNLTASQLYYKAFVGNQSLATTIICPVGSIFDNTSQTCVTKISDSATRITLQKTGSPSTFTLFLTNSNSDLLKMVVKSTNVYFSGYFEGTDYTYSLQSLPSDSTKINIVLTYLQPMSNPIFIVNIDLPSNFVQNFPNDIIIVNNQMYLNDIFILSATDKALGATTATSISATRMITIISIIVSSALAKSFAAVQTLMLVNLVFYLKYINIDYPPHMQQLFVADEFALPFLIFNYNSPNNLIIPAPSPISNNYNLDIRFTEDIFLTYNVKLYFLDNFGDNLVQFMIVFFVAMVIFKGRKHVTNPKLSNVVTKIFDFLCWGWILNFFLTNFRNIFLYIFRVWYYCKVETSFAKFDLFMTILIFIIMIMSTLHIWKVNRVIREGILRKEKLDAKKKTLENKKDEEELFTKVAVEILSPNEYKGPGEKLEEGNITKIHLYQNEFHRNNQSSSKMMETWAATYYLDEDYEKKYMIINNDYYKLEIITINYVLIFLMRFLGYSFIIVIFYNVPFLQVLLIQYINVIFFIYLIVSKPFESNIKYFFALIQEVVVIYLYFYPLVLSGYELTGRIYDEDKMNIGKYFLNSYLMFTVVIMITVILGIIVTLIENSKKKKEENAKKKEDDEKKKKEEETKKEDQEKKKEEEINKEGEKKKEGETEKEGDSKKEGDAMDDKKDKDDLKGEDQQYEGLKLFTEDKDEDSIRNKKPFDLEIGNKD